MKDFELFDIYRREHTRNVNGNYCDVDYLLRLWRENKGQYLTKLFGDKLILEKPIEYKRNEEELYRDMDKMIESQQQYFQELNNELYIQMDEPDIWSRARDVRDSAYYYLRKTLYNNYSLIENTVEMYKVWYNFDNTVQDKSYTIVFENGNKVTMQNGMKLTRLWGQIAKAIHKEDAWEKIRIAHSQILNQKKLKGTLCLSIHPLDYATASDNANGWSSCMSWAEEGCYRMGTVEMMNSPMVICAYLRSDAQHMEIGNSQWNSKKWRAWIIVTKDAILCNRNYPYYQAHFCETACEWVRDLVEKAYGWKYGELHEDLPQYIEDTYGSAHGPQFTTNFMYNDVGVEKNMGMLAYGEKNLPMTINFSGPAECMVCGDEIHYGSSVETADTLECDNCRRVHTCNSCGSELDENDVRYDPDGNTICPECFEEYCCECSNCGEIIWRENAANIVMPVHLDRAKMYLDNMPSSVRSHFNRHLFAVEGEDCCLCGHCASKIPTGFAKFAADDKIKISMYGNMEVPDPLRCDINTALNIIRPSGWNEASSLWASGEYARGMRGFWEDQWIALKEDFENAQYFKNAQ